jgi:hypothetical protein
MLTSSQRIETLVYFLFLMKNNNGDDKKISLYTASVIRLVLGNEYLHCHNDGFHSLIICRNFDIEYS